MHRSVQLLIQRQKPVRRQPLNQAPYQDDREAVQSTEARLKKVHAHNQANGASRKATPLGASRRQCLPQHGMWYQTACISFMKKNPAKRHFGFAPKRTSAVYTWRRMRVLAPIVVAIWVLLPQVVCFLPGEEKTETEMDCCQRMAGDCGKANMQEHKCCRSVVKADAAIITAAHRDLLPDSAVAPPYISEELTRSGLIAERAIFVSGYIHPPPKDSNTSITVLRI